MGSFALHAIFFCLLLTYLSTGFSQEVSIQPVLLDVGNQNDFKPDSPMRKAAYRSSANTRSPLTQWFDASARNGTGFYLFYNQVQVSQLPAAFVVQKIRRTITSVGTDGETETKTTFLIEAIKLDNGWLEKPDQHFGSFEIGNHDKRIIRKECEVGVVSELAGVNVDAGKWQWQDGVLYQKLHDYADDPSDAPAVKFVCSRKWNFEFVFTSTGGFSLSVPDLDYSIVVSVPRPLPNKVADGSPSPLPSVKAGIGIVDRVQVGHSTLSDAIAEFGKPKAVYPQKNRKRNVEFSNGLIVHVDADDIVMTIMNARGCIVQAEFNGQIVTVGETKDAIIQKLGPPSDSVSGGTVFSYQGLTIWFDAETSSKFVISEPRKPE